jgi:indole-3-glycerol phosphate synthase
MSVLDDIVKRKQERLKFTKAKIPLRELKARIADMKQPADFHKAIKNGGTGIKLIAELKKASPSKGLIRPDFDPVEIAKIYQEKADAISVLTEEDFFQGDLGYLARVKVATDRPLLRKDFIVDEYQIYESRAAGADAFLLIESELERQQAVEYLHLASELGMAVLFEVHDFYGLEKALLVDAPIIGINNRDLKTLKIDLNTTFEMLKEIPKGKTVVSESGISTPWDVKKFEEAGIDALLIGTTIMQSNDIAKKIEELFPGR